MADVIVDLLPEINIFLIVSNTHNQIVSDIFTHDIFQQNVLTDSERDILMTISEYSRPLYENFSKICEAPYKLKTGRPVDAAKGLQVRMNVDSEIFFRRMSMRLEGLIEEMDELASQSDDSSVKEAKALLHYIVFESCSEFEYPNGVRDKGRTGMSLKDFLLDQRAKDAHLTEEEVVSIRLYSTSAYKFMNDPLRDDARYEAQKPCPLAVASYWAQSGIKKLRSIVFHSNVKPPPVYRGMRNLEVFSFTWQNGCEVLNSLDSLWIGNSHTRL